MNDIFFDLDVDSYKTSHHLQIPPGLTNISSYVEPRSGPDEIVFFGLQAWLKKSLGNVKTDDVMEMESYVEAHGLPFNPAYEDLVGIRFPLKIQALAEGSIVKPGTCLVQVTNTDPRFPWLTSFVETSLLRAVWYPTTVATKSREIKKVLRYYLSKTGDVNLLSFKLHDFGFRGVSSYESGCIGGLAHLVNFMGTDTMGALKYARRFYQEEMAGFSIPAAEHSTITSWGRDGETAAYRNMIEKFDHGLFAVVSDSYDIFNACENIWGNELKSRVQEIQGTLVIRPDSGDPLTVVMKCLDILEQKFGTTTNSKGFKVLPPFLRIIQGDGVNKQSITAILSKMMVHGWSADNIAFGMGGALLQAVTRDDFSFAMKASAKSNDNGVTWEGFAKDPVTMASKKSKAGRLAVIRSLEGDFTTVDEPDLIHPSTNQLMTVWKDGELLIDQTLKDVRARAEVH